MSKLLISIALTAGVTLYAGASKPEPKKEQKSKKIEAIESYMRHNIVTNPRVDIVNITIMSESTRKEIPGWDIVFTVTKLAYKNKTQMFPKVYFMKDGLITTSLATQEKGISFEKLLRPRPTEDMYNKEHLVFGSPKAKHRILVFSDPMCPYCRESVPGILEAAKKYPDIFAVYYYHVPLVSHPAAAPLTAIMHVAQEHGRNDVVLEAYRVKQEYITKTDIEFFIKEIKKISGFEAKMSEVNSTKTLQAIDADRDMSAKVMLQGTPTIYFDDEWDSSKDKYKEFIPGAKKEKNTKAK